MKWAPLYDSLNIFGMVLFWGWEDPLEKETAIHASIASILAWKNPMDGGARQATVQGLAKSWTLLSDFTFNLLVNEMSVIAQ